MGKQLVIIGADFSNVAIRTLSSIAITTNPTKTVYHAGEYFDPAGMVVTATYTDSTTSTVINYTYSPTTALTTSTTGVTVSYSYNGVTATAQVSITVTA